MRPSQGRSQSHPNVGSLLNIFVLLCIKYKIRRRQAPEKMMIPAHEATARGTHASPITPRHWDSPEPHSHTPTSPIKTATHVRIQKAKTRRQRAVKEKKGCQSEWRRAPPAAPTARLPAPPLPHTSGLLRTAGKRQGGLERGPTQRPPARHPARALCVGLRGWVQDDVLM